MEDFNVAKNKPETPVREQETFEVENLKVTISLWPRLPKGQVEVLALFIVLAFLGLVLWLFRERLNFSFKDKDNNLLIWTVEPNSIAEPNKTNYYQICFWTPSPETQRYLTNAVTSNPAWTTNDERWRETYWRTNVMAWQTNGTEANLDEFGRCLKEYGSILGYRRVLVYGQGQHHLKPGYWWTVTVGTNITVKELMMSYKVFWKPTETVYVETIGDLRHSRN
jgi:hypothetical protein